MFSVYVIRDSSTSNPYFHDFDVGGRTGVRVRGISALITVYGIHKKIIFSASAFAYFQNKIGHYTEPLGTPSHMYYGMTMINLCFAF